MPFELFKTIIDSNREFIRYLDLYVMGEPLLHPEISRMARYASRFNIWTRIYTNGTLVTTEASRELIAASLHAITFSIDWQGRAEYKNIKIGPSDNSVVGNIIRLVSLRESSKTPYPCINVSIVAAKMKRRERRKAIVAMKRLGVDYVHVVPVREWHGCDKGAGCVENMQMRPRYFSCYLPWVSMSILWDGRVIGCCDDYDSMFVVGDVKESPLLSSIWNGENMQYLRYKLANRRGVDLPACKNCKREHEFPFRYSLSTNTRWVIEEYLTLRVRRYLHHFKENSTLYG
jgi:radical SAM protein with 4Fe4S-binding SPASM domain